jgi:hypothetical protein
MYYFYTRKINNIKYSFIYNTENPNEVKVLYNNKVKIFYTPFTFTSLQDFNNYHEEYFNDEECVKSFLHNLKIN